MWANSVSRFVVAEEEEEEGLDDDDDGVLRWSEMISTIFSPMMGKNLKPWPEPPVVRIRFLWCG